MDWELLIPLVKRMPEVSFVFAGPVDASAAELPQLENIHFIGRVEYRELPKFVAGLEALMLPYRTGELSEAISPLKLKEYLATGKPVVSTPIAEARRWSDVICNAETVVEWNDVLSRLGDRLPNLPRLADDRRLFKESWKHKADKFLEICG